MNINGINSDYSNNYFTKVQKLKESENNYEVGSFQGLFSAAQSSGKDSLIDKYLNITDSMPRESRISFAASIMANKVLNDGVTEETKGFMKNIADRFTSDEIASLKNEIRAFASDKNANADEVENMLQVFDGFVSQRNSMGITESHQAKPALNNMDMFYRASLGL